jgi:hypothetical protein
MSNFRGFDHGNRNGRTPRPLATFSPARVPLRGQHPGIFHDGGSINSENRSRANVRTRDPYIRVPPMGFGRIYDPGFSGEKSPGNILLPSPALIPEIGDVSPVAMMRADNMTPSPYVRELRWKLLFFGTVTLEQ